MHPADVAYELLVKADGSDAVDTRRLLDTGDLIRSFSKFSELSAPAADAVSALVTPRTFAKDEWLLRGGDRAQWSFFITRGLVRELYIDAAGAEHVRTFIAEGGLTGSLVDLISQRPAITWIQALEPTHTLAFAYSDLARLCDEHPSLQRAARRFAENLYVRKVIREYELQALPARQRYKIWKREWRAIDLRVRRRDLASFLGVTPEHLSRLRANRGD
jgi:CRP-like cAMP-binding protein